MGTVIDLILSRAAVRTHWDNIHSDLILNTCFIGLFHVAGELRNLRAAARVGKIETFCSGE